MYSRRLRDLEKTVASKIADADEAIKLYQTVFEEFVFAHVLKTLSRDTHVPVGL